ncbi:protein rep [Secundilactobacillus malefermentans]|uniref:protein rep n=1 Tax=Secundilactobacillus malefermentans TaxID=176292 RepID=UPI0013899DB0|nr:protein rep [Secundilactobacillus malefermentans]
MQTLFCPPRLRSLCMWRRAMKQPNQLTQILEKAVKQQKTVHFLFLTPTVENTTDALSINKKTSRGCTTWSFILFWD